MKPTAWIIPDDIQFLMSKLSLHRVYKRVVQSFKQSSTYFLAAKWYIAFILACLVQASLAVPVRYIFLAPSSELLPCQMPEPATMGMKQ